MSQYRWPIKEALLNHCYRSIYTFYPTELGPNRFWGIHWYKIESSHHNMSDTSITLIYHAMFLTVLYDLEQILQRNFCSMTI